MSLQGCVLSSTSIVYPSNTDYPVPWDTEFQFGDLSFFDVGTDDTVLDMPVDVDGELVEFFGALANSSAGGVGQDGNTLVQRVSPSVLVLNGMQHDNLRWQPFAQRTGLHQVSSGDTFRTLYRTFGTTGAANDARCHFGCLVNPQNHLLGLVEAQGVSPGQNVSTGANLQWDTPNIDTLSTHDGSTIFTAPPRAKACVVTLYGSTTPGSSGFVTWAIDKNLSQYALAQYDSQFRAGWGGCWLIPVRGGDTIRAYLDGSNTTIPAETHINIEWYG